MENPSPQLRAEPFDTESMFDTPLGMKRRVARRIWGDKPRNFQMDADGVDEVLFALSQGTLHEHIPGLRSGEEIHQEHVDRLIADPVLAEELGQRYTILGEVGRGGLADIYGALDRKTNQFTVLKVVDFLQQDAIGGPRPIPDELKLRFFRSIYILALCCDHPNLIQGTDFSTVTDNAGAIALKWSGISMLDELRKHPAYQLPFLEEEGMGVSVARVAHHVASALAHLHQKGIVHRDVKPGNVLLYRGNAVLGDFGIAHFASVPREPKILHPAYDWFFDPESDYLTQESVQGTPTFLPPEAVAAILGKRPYLPVSQGDLYSLGVTLYQLLTGRVPFSFVASEQDACFQRMITEDPEPISSFRDDVPSSFEAMVMLLLSKNPGIRPSAQYVASHLSRVLSA